MTAMAGSDVVQSGRPIFDDFFQHLWPYIGNNTADVVFQMLQDIMIVQVRNEKVSNHGSIPITINCNVVAFIVFEEVRTNIPPAQSVFLDVTMFRYTLVD
ncbi:hypothetical protein TNCV_3790201 [Trichonephila clavipes]|nr:hypothetical protein TNCV_3790201 [Trichonephila clavipes]